MKMYGLRIKGKKDLLIFEVYSNAGAEFCTEVEHILCEPPSKSYVYEYPIWLVNNKEIAEKAAKKSTDWYNATYETPNWENKKWELEVVEVELTF